MRSIRFWVGIGTRLGTLGLMFYPFYWSLSWLPSELYLGPFVISWDRYYATRKERDDQ